MINIRELPLILMMAFTLVYSTIGNPESEAWSGLYFFTHWLLIFFLIKDNKSKIIRIIGKSLCISIELFIISKYLFSFQYERYYTILPFSICLIGFILIEKRKNDEPHRRKTF